MNLIIIVTISYIFGAIIQASPEIEECRKMALRFIPDESRTEKKFWIDKVTPLKIVSQKRVPKLPSCSPTTFLEEQKCESIHYQYVLMNREIILTSLAESKKYKEVVEFYKTVQLVDDEYTIYEEEITSMSIYSDPTSFEIIPKEEIPKILQQPKRRLYALVSEANKWEIYLTCNGELAWSQIVNEDYTEEELEEIYEAIDLSIRNRGIGKKCCMKQVDRELMFSP